MKKSKKLLISVATMTTLFGVVSSLDLVDAATKVSPQKEKALVQELKEEFTEFNIYGPVKNPIGLLNDDKFVITSNSRANNILKSDDRYDYLKAYNEAKKNGVTTATNSTVKQLHSEYGKIVSYAEGVKYTTSYQNQVSKYSNSYSKVLSENYYKSLGVNDKTNQSKARGRALKEYQDFKKRVGTASPKRISNLQTMYKNSTSFSLASHYINLANAQSLKSTSSISKAKSYVASAKKQITSITDSKAKQTINTAVTKATNKITKAQQQLQQKPSTDNPNNNQGNSNNSGNSNSSNNNVSSSVSQYEKEVVTLVNKERAKAGLSALKLDTNLSKVARIKSQDMQSKGYFSHNSPTYGSPFDMMKQFGITYSYAGENIAQGQTSPQAVVTAWMNSEGHRKNILSSSFTHIGVGHVANGNYWTQMFIGK